MGDIKRLNNISRARANIFSLLIAICHLFCCGAENRCIFRNPEPFSTPCLDGTTIALLGE